MINKIRSYIDENRLLKNCQSLIVGLSGGADSVCLLLVLKELQQVYGYRLVSVHVHHGIRGEEADRDLLFCKSLSEENGIEFRDFHFDVPQYALEHHLSTEEAGRLLRYQAMRQVAVEYDNAKIAVAHHMNDQAETVLFNMARGSGLAGLRGMLPQKDGIIRPLLCVDRGQIEEYLNALGQKYCTDSTNESREYARNRIRHSILPELADSVNTNAAKNIARLAASVAGAEEYLEKITAAAYAECAQKNPGSITLTGLEKKDEYIAKRLIRLAIGEMLLGLKDVTAVHVNNAYEVIFLQNGRCVDIKDGLVCKKNYEGICFCQKSIDRADKVNNFIHTVDIPSEIVLDNGKKFEFQLIPYNKDAKILNEVYTKWFDYDKIKGVLALRNRREGDYLFVDGNGHKKKLSRYFIDEKIPEAQRESAVLLADDSHIMWIVGGRISAEYKITADTERILQVQYKGADDGKN